MPLSPDQGLEAARARVLKSHCVGHNFGGSKRHNREHRNGQCPSASSRRNRLSTGNGSMWNERLWPSQGHFEEKAVPSPFKVDPPHCPRRGGVPSIFRRWWVPDCHEGRNLPVSRVEVLLSVATIVVVQTSTERDNNS